MRVVVVKPKITQHLVGGEDFIVAELFLFLVHKDSAGFALFFGMLSRVMLRLLVCQVLRTLLDAEDII